MCCSRLRHRVGDEDQAGVCRTPVWRPTSERRMPLADSRAAAVSGALLVGAVDGVEDGRLAQIAGDPGVRDR